MGIDLDGDEPGEVSKCIGAGCGDDCCMRRQRYRGVRLFGVDIVDVDVPRLYDDYVALASIAGL